MTEKSPEALQTYEVTLLFDASQSATVQATSIEEAIRRASDEIGSPHLCHQCTNEVELGDCYSEIVYLDGDMVEDTDYRSKEIARLNTRIAELEAQLAQRERPALTDEPVTGQVHGPLIARQLGEWHEDDGAVMWWAWNGREWAGEPAWCGTPNSSDWPGYHTHWTPHPDQPVAHGIGDPT